MMQSVESNTRHLHPHHPQHTVATSNKLHPSHLSPLSTNHTPFTIMQGHRKLVGVLMLSAVLLLMAAQFGGMHTFIGTYSIDDAEIVVIKEKPHASNAPLVGSNMVLHPLLSRVWNPRTGNNYSWCVPPGVGEEETVVNGLIYVKVHKTASSTSAGVNRQISRNIGETMLGTGKSCRQRSNHAKAVEFRERKPPFLLWTTLREPSKRAISQFFHFQVSRRGVKPSSQNMINRLHADKNFQLNYISTQEIPSNATHRIAVQDPVKLIRRNVFERYHFIAITERMQESLVVMKMLWGLSDKDIIVMSAKHSGGYDDGRYKETCVKIQPSFTTPEVDRYIKRKFREDNLDYLLYAAANESLDLTISSLGRLRFDKELERHRRLQKIAEDACLDKTDFPCSSNGTRQPELAARNCLKHDMGCGYQCVNELFQKQTFV
jgi:hypothetical protein